MRNTDHTARVPTAVVTGGNRGIGHAVAAQITQLGHRVVLVARDGDRGRAALAGLHELDGPRAELVVGDLADVAGVRDTAQALTEKCPEIDVLVHNAGVWPSRRQLNDDGVEQAFCTNHLAPFLLNHLLEPTLLASGTRVVQVSAGLYVKGRADPERTPTGADFHPMRTYADTKLCNLLLLPLWARRWQDSGVTIDALHPGVIRTGLGARSGALGLLLKLVKLTWKSPDTGAGPVVRLALSDADSRRSGRYYVIDDETPLEPVADDPVLAERLWQQALELTGLPAAPPRTDVS